MTDDDSAPDRASPAVPGQSESETAEDSPGSAGGHSAELDGLAAQEGWHVEAGAARVHYSGATDRYSIEYYEPSGCVLYWKVPPEDAGETAVPVGRGTVPTPLRERIREDLATAGIDPDTERQQL